MAVSVTSSQQLTEMQRSGYTNPAPARSPPLHHPVPQHVSTVPMMRSPPPPAPQQNYGNQYQPQGDAQYSNGTGGGTYGNFLNDQTAQMGFQVGRSAVMAGQEYVEQNFNRFVNVSILKHYFDVSNLYVVNKLILVLFPWRHKPWSRQQKGSGGSEAFFAPPREDINSPDMYIPSMAFVTHILLSTLLAGVRGAFHPELLGLTATTATAVVIFEIILLKLGCYFLSISNESQLLDLVAYSGYKFVGIIVTVFLSEIFNYGQGTGGWFGWTIFIYTFLANSLFLLRSLKYVLLPDSNPDANRAGPMATHTVARAQRSRRTQFLFVYAYVVQFVLMWILTRQPGSSQPKAVGDAAPNTAHHMRGSY